MTDKCWICKKIAQKSDDFSSHELADFILIVKIDAKEHTKNRVVKKLHLSRQESLRMIVRYCKNKACKGARNTNKLPGQAASM